MKNVTLPYLCGVPKFVLLWFVGNTTSLDHQLCVKTIIINDRECTLLREQLRGQEVFCKVSTMHDQ